MVALAQRREIDRDDVEPIEKVLAEASRSGRQRKIARDQAVIAEVPCPDSMKGQDMRGPRWRGLLLLLVVLTFASALAAQEPAAAAPAGLPLSVLFAVGKSALDADAQKVLGQAALLLQVGGHPDDQREVLHRPQAERQGQQPGQRCAFLGCVGVGLLPDAQETVLQRFIGPIPTFQHTQQQRIQMRAAGFVQQGERALVAGAGLGQQANQALGIGGGRAHRTSGLERFERDWSGLCEAYFSISPTTRWVQSGFATQGGIWLGFCLGGRK